MRNREPSKVKQVATVLFAIAFFLTCFVAFFVLPAVAPCDWLDWLPLSHLPARCLGTILHR